MRLALLLVILASGCINTNPNCKRADVFDDICIITNGFPVDLDKASKVFDLTEQEVNKQLGVDVNLDKISRRRNLSLEFIKSDGEGPQGRTYHYPFYAHIEVEEKCAYMILSHELLHVIAHSHFNVSEETNKNHQWTGFSHSCEAGDTECIDNSIEMQLFQKIKCS